MRSHRLQRWLAVGAMVMLPVMAFAQEATVSGSIADTTGGALPGVTVRAVNEASGNSFEVVTDESGGFRLPVRVGVYRVMAELSGFAPVTRTLTLLVGQQVVLNLLMGVSGVQEAVTVSGQAPLLDVTQSSLGGNIDPRQLQELPVNGRNWIDLVMLVPGARGNAVTEAPLSLGGTTARGDYQINVDGQQVTVEVSSTTNDGQPRYSRDAIAEFEFLSSRFDATQSRSSGVQVNAITKSGTNRPSGSFSGYFRDDSMNAADFVAKRVLPYQNEQLSATFGGPIRKDKLHFFANYEYERVPLTALYTTPYAHFNHELNTVNTEKKSGVKLDAQFSPRTRLAVRGNQFTYRYPYDATATSAGGSTQVPSTARGRARETNQVLATLTQVLSNQVLNEVRVGYAGYDNETLVFLKNPLARFDGLNGPTISLAGLTAGGASSFPEAQQQDVYSVRDDFTYSFTKGGNHTLKLGADYLHQKNVDHRCNECEGTLDATRPGPPALTNDLMMQVFPDLNDVSTWDLAPLSPLTRTWRQLFGLGDSVIPRNRFGIWLQDDWTVVPRLTLNLGVRYDLETNAFANDVEILPFLPGRRPDDRNNLSPRLGFSFSLSDRTVIRGGFGLYFGTVTNAHLTYNAAQTIRIAIPNDGRADFASNPWNGPTPTFADILAQVCAPGSLDPECRRREILTGSRYFGPGSVMPYSYQPAIGFQRQLGDTMAIEADYLYVGYRKVPWTYSNVNLTYDPVTGANYPFSDISKRPYPEWGVVRMTLPNNEINSHALQTTFTKRFSHSWQASGTYTLSGLWDRYPAVSGTDVVPFAVAPDLYGGYALASGDQRHRATFNGIWQLRYGFQLSGLYFFGSGERVPTFYGTDVRNLGINTDERRLRPDGTIVPRNNFVGDPIHRVDLRLQRRFSLGSHAGIDGIVEVFNVLNHANYGTYGGTTYGAAGGEVSRTYQQPSQNANLAYAPRMVQLGFRFTF